MATTTKHAYAVTTALGTFTRTTHRTYTHVVVSRSVVLYSGRTVNCEWCGSAERAATVANKNRKMRRREGNEPMFVEVLTVPVPAA